MSRAFEGGGEVHADVQVGPADINSGTSLGAGFGRSLSIGKTSDSSHDFSRTVSIFLLDDNDLGNNFI